MKTMLVLLLLPLYSLCQNLDSLDAKNGYKDLRFDMPFNSILLKTKAKKLMESKKQHFAIYEIKEPKYLTIGEHKVTAWLVKNTTYNLLYYFSISFLKTGSEERKNVLTLFNSLYGQPVEKDSTIEQYKWVGNKVALEYFYHRKEKQSSAHITNVEVEKLLLMERYPKAELKMKKMLYN